MCLSHVDEEGARLLETRAPFSSCWHLLLGRRVVPSLALRATFGLQGGKFNYCHLCPLLCSCMSVALNSLSWTFMFNTMNLHIRDREHPHINTTLLSTFGRRLGERLNTRWHYLQVAVCNQCSMFVHSVFIVLCVCFC